MSATFATRVGTPDPGRDRSGTQPRVPSPGVIGPGIASAVAVLLSAIALAPLVDSGSWFGATFLAVVVVTVIGALTTWARVPVFLVPIFQSLGLFATLVASYTTDAPLRFVPSPDAMRALREVLSAGMGDIDQYSPPVPYSAGVSAVVAIGIGCVAIVVFVLEVNLRMPVVAGFALIAVYVVPSFVLDDGSPWWAFAFVAVGWMVLLISDERVGLVSWGRLLRRADKNGPGSPLAGLSSAAIRLGALAIVTAIALPILIPSLADAVLGRSATGLGGTGDGTGAQGDASSTVGLGAVVSLRRDLRQNKEVVVLRYTTTATNPSYLRAAVLEDYANESWRARDFQPASSTRVVDGTDLQTDIGTTVATTPTTYTFSDVKLDASYLPVAEHAERISGLAGQWYVDSQTQTVFGVDSTTSGASWGVGALETSPTIAQLRSSTPAAAPDPEQVRLAAGIPPDLADAARAWTAGATTNFDRAVALQNYFRDRFTYDANAKSDQSTSYLEQFLRDRTGYCEQFAATMALMARSLGIPARVVVGYTPGTRSADDVWVVRGKDAHAWPELFLGGVGWVRFEPTPGGAAGGGAAPLPVTSNVPAATPSSSTGPGATPSGDPKLSRLLEAERPADAGTFDGPAVDTATTADQWRLRVLLGVLVLGLAAAAVPAVWRWARRRRRLSTSASVEDAWEELRDTARDLGVPWSDAQTPRQAVAAVITRQRLRGADADAATRVGRTTERSRYAATAPSTIGLADDVSTVRTALLDRVDLATRVRATLLPASLRNPQD